MKKAIYTTTIAAIALLCSCSGGSSSSAAKEKELLERENAILKKENELMKKEGAATQAPVRKQIILGGTFSIKLKAVASSCGFFDVGDTEIHEWNLDKMGGKVTVKMSNGSYCSGYSDDEQSLNFKTQTILKDKGAYDDEYSIRLDDNGDISGLLTRTRKGLLLGGGKVTYELTGKPIN